MPCNCDYMEPSRYEIESVRTAENLVYAIRELGKPIPVWIKEASEAYYGNVQRLNEMVVLLCKVCHDMSKEEQDSIIYNGRSKEARQLADWWDTHQEADKKRLEQEEAAKKKAELRLSALSKLSDEERKALGI